MEYTEEAVRIRQSTITAENWYTCTINDGTCIETASTTVLVQATSTPILPSLSTIRAALPAGSTRLTRSPDNRYVAFYIPATQTRGERTFGIIDTTTLETFTKTEPVAYWDLLTEGIRVFSFSPDGKTLLYISDEKNHPTLYSVDLSVPPTNGTLRSTKLFTREYTVADVAWVDSETILFIANRENPYLWTLYQYSLKANTLAKIQDNADYSTNIERAGSVFLFGETTQTGTRPAIYDHATKIVRYFTLPTTDALSSEGKVVTTLKHNLGGVFLLEANKNSDTLLVWLHGGPYRQASTLYHPYQSYGGYDWVLENARRANVGVLKLDYPRSAGFGRTFAESLTGKVGVVDVQKSSEAIADFAKRNGYKNVYLMGNSYGGYLALRLLVEEPKLYKGAFSINGVTDWLTMLTALDSSIFNVQFGGTVSDENANHTLYANASIYNRASNLAGQKVVLMHGENDTTIPSRQSSGFATFLSSIGKSHLYIPLPEENHVFKKQESFTLLCHTALAFVEKDSASSCRL
jgi:dipeptidyl aminopeptidase/acylaminoacyl peptidase